MVFISWHTFLHLSNPTYIKCNMVCPIHWFLFTLFYLCLYSEYDMISPVLLYRGLYHTMLPVLYGVIWYALCNDVSLYSMSYHISIIIWYERPYFCIELYPTMPQFCMVRYGVPCILVLSHSTVYLTILPIWYGRPALPVGQVIPYNNHSFLFSLLAWI